ncbi:hypothetical protein ACFE04_004449 [Oxalis oulophora]
MSFEKRALDTRPPSPPPVHDRLDDGLGVATRWLGRWLFMHPTWDADLMYPLLMADFGSSEFYPEYFGAIDLKQMLLNKDLEIALVTTLSADDQRMYEFAYPRGIIPSPPKGKIRHIRREVGHLDATLYWGGAPPRFILAPYLNGGHWVLIVIDTLTFRWYYLDPKNSGYVRPHVKSIVIGLGFEGVRVQEGLPNPPIRRTDLELIIVPHQPSNFECGYYLLPDCARYELAEFTEIKDFVARWVWSEIPHPSAS